MYKVTKLNVLLVTLKPVW